MNDVNLKVCKFATEIVPYMYGELRVSDASAFESHLLECTDCTDEFAAVSSARFEVYDWKKLEFDSLPTPAFEIPHVAAEASGSWIAKIRVVFDRPWAVPAASFAALALVSVFAASVYFSTGTRTDVVESKRDTLEVTSQQAPPVAGVSPHVPATAIDTDELEQPTEPKPRPVRAVAVRTSSPKRPVRRGEAAKPDKVAPMQTADKRAPRLNEFNEDEDTSLRLAQLFEDVDTKK